MSVDATLRAIVEAAQAPVLSELRAVRAELAELRAQAKPPELRPLATILSISPRAALGRLDRDAELRSLGLRVGRRLLFRAEEVRGLYARRQRDAEGAR